MESFLMYENFVDKPLYLRCSFLSWRLQSAYICDRLCHILSLLWIWDVVVGQSLFAVPSKGFTQARNIGFYLTAMDMTYSLKKK